MTIIDTLKRSARNLKQAKTRTILTALALAVGGFTLTLTLAAANGAKAYSSRLVSANLDPSSLIVAKDKTMFGGGGGGVNSKPQEYDDSFGTLGRGGSGTLVKQLSRDDITKISKIEGVESVFLYYNTNTQYVTRDGAKKYTAGAQAFDKQITHQYAAGTVSGDVPDGHVVLPDSYVSLLNFKNDQDAIGKQITVQLRQTAGGSETRLYTVAAVLTSPPTLISGDVNTTLLFGQNDAASIYAYVNAGTFAADHFLIASARVINGTDAKTLKATQDRIIAAGYAAESAADTQALINQIINVLQIIILVFGFITLVASFFGVVNTQYISVLERTREIGLMKALGMSRGSVLRLFVIEATWIGFLGAVLGSFMAIGLGTLLNPWISDKLNFGSDRLLVFKPSQLAILVLFLMVVTTIAGLLPARHAARLDPIEALRTE
jgi:putative ABC transport system permease protein